MDLRNAHDVLELKGGELISKRNLFDVIQHSKDEKSAYWTGQEFAIGNTPQQGINWIGTLPNLHAVIIKTRPGAYKTDGWKEDNENVFCYSFKARNGRINLSEKANEVLIKQAEYGYPILPFIETVTKNVWHYEGSFRVSGIEEKFVVLERMLLQHDAAESS